MNSQHEQIRQIIGLLAEPTTIHTTEEVWCRVASTDGAESLLLALLGSDRAEVVKLVLNVVAIQMERVGIQSIELIGAVEKCLMHTDRLVVQAAIGAVKAIKSSDREVIKRLSEIMRAADKIIAIDAANALIILSHFYRDEAREFIANVKLSHEVELVIAAEKVELLQ